MRLIKAAGFRQGSAFCVCEGRTEVPCWMRLGNQRRKEEEARENSGCHWYPSSCKQLGVCSVGLGSKREALHWVAFYWASNKNKVKRLMPLQLFWSLFFFFFKLKKDLYLAKVWKLVWISSNLFRNDPPFLQSANQMPEIWWFRHSVVFK